MLIGALAGVGISAAYILPDAMFADIIEWDELRTGQRQEGVYFGARAFMRKMAGAAGVFISLQLLGWIGYTSPPEGVTQYQQTDQALAAIRFLVSPFGAALLFGAVIMAWLYPLTRERYAHMQRLLERRRQRG
jgi:GPH family glycoside/pentoside/hexuronide:cation symporter